MKLKFRLRAASSAAAAVPVVSPSVPEPTLRPRDYLHCGASCPPAGAVCPKPSGHAGAHDWTSMDALSAGR